MLLNAMSSVLLVLLIFLYRLGTGGADTNAKADSRLPAPLTVNLLDESTRLTLCFGIMRSPL